MRPPYIVKNFQKGLVTRLEPQSIPAGAASDALNWLSLGDRIELRRGYGIMGSENEGVGRISGLFVGRLFDNTQVPVKAYGRKIKYFDRTIGDWITSSYSPANVRNNTHSITLDRALAQYLNAGNSASLSYTGDHTIEFWIKVTSTPDSGEYRSIISKSRGATRSYDLFYTNIGGVPSLEYYIFPDQTGSNYYKNTLAQTLTEGEWHHVALVITIANAAATKAEWFIDGASVGNGTGADIGTGATVMDVTTTDVTVGVRSDGEEIDGKLDEFRLWDDARTSVEIAANFEHELTGSESNLVAYWSLNNSLDDQTANANDLTPVNDPDFTTDVPFSGANILPASGDGEDMAFDDYTSLSGAIVYGSTPSSGNYKIMLASPGDVLDQAMQNHRGKIRIKQNRTFLWDRKDTSGGSDKTGLFGSYIDKDELSDFTNVLGESVGTGDGSTATFSGTLTMQKTNRTFTASGDTMTSNSHGFSDGDPLKLSTTGTMPAGLIAGQVYFVVSSATNTFKLSLTVNGPPITTTTAGSGTHTATKGIRRSVMFVTISDTAEQFVDDRNGNLNGSLGGTGTINYATGAYSITFNTAPANLQAITASYYWEDAYSQGIMDFTKSGPRTAGQGFVFRQDDAGEFMNIGSIGATEYCMHRRKTYALTLSSDDTNATNLIYREKVGIPYWRAMVETGDGIYYIDDIDQNDPYLRLLRLTSQGINVIPLSYSDNVSLAPYRFDLSSMREWGNYIVFTGRTKDSEIPNRMFFYHKLWKSIDVMDYRGSCLEEYASALIGGDSGSNNVFKYFDGWTDEESNIQNFWISGKINFGLEGTKKVTKFVVGGLISRDQRFKVSLAFENGDFIDVGTITGDGEYVDQGQIFQIGSTMTGGNEIGGNNDIDTIEASPYRAEFNINTDRFEYIRVRFEALDVGYVSVSEYQFKDIRFKGKKLPSQYIIPPAIFT